MSEVVSTLLLVAIVVSLGVVIFTFASGGMSSLTEGFTGLMTSKQNAVGEHFVVEQVAFTTTSVGGAIPVLLTNSQTSATPTSFQQMITWDPATYAAYESTSLGNVRFCTTAACTSELYSWLESCSGTCSTGGSSSTSATAWVNLGTSTIAANGGTLTIYMVFEPTGTNFDGVYWGEAPQLSSTYAQYDNGAKVFNAYFNGNTATSNFGANTNVVVSQATGVTGPGATTINAIHISGYAGTAAEFDYTQALGNSAMIVEGSFANANDGSETGELGLMDNVAPASVLNGINVGDGAGTDYFNNMYYIAGAQTNTNNAGAGVTTWVYGSVTYTGPTATSWTGYIAPQLYSVTGGYQGTVANNPLSAATNVYMGGGFGSNNAGFPLSLNINFMRARDYPPAGVMPTITSFGALVPAATGADVYVKNVGTVASTLVSVFVEDQTTATLVGQFPISTTLNAGAFVDIPHTTVTFTPTAGETYSFTVTSSLGNSVIFYAEVA